MVQGHFGEWLQGRLGPEGPVALVTLVCPALCAVAPGGGLRLEDVFDAAQLDRFRAALGLAGGDWPGIGCAMPLGAGAGASTACLVAAARAAGFGGGPEALARACLAAEGASDPLMFEAPDRVLWASREGRIVAHLPPPPSCEVVGGLWGAPERTDAADLGFADVTDLVGAWRGAAEAGDLPAAARIASISAGRCAALRGGAGPMADLVAALGALGHVRAHTGSARGLIFAPGGAPEDAAEVLCAAGLRDIVAFRTGGRA